mgnify:CR=1 FL=1
MSTVRTIGFYSTPPVVLGAAYAVYRMWFGGAEPAPETEENVPPPVVAPAKQIPGDKGPATAPPGAVHPKVETRVAVPQPPVQPAAGVSPITDLARALQLLPELAAGMSGNPLLGRWAAMTDVLPRLVAAVDCIANGQSPRRHLDFLAPVGAFSAQRVNGGWVIDPGSYGRYDRVTAAGTSIDAEAFAAAFVRLEPVLDLVYGQLGYEGGRCRDALTAAAAELCAVPLPAEPVHLVGRGTIYEFADGQLQALSAAQKHLLRAGPENARRVQAKIREIAAALGLPLQ